jgi:hypothetical protein
MQQGGDERHYVLTTGTNRLKTYQEIVATANAVTEDGWVKLSLPGSADLKVLLSRLPDVSVLASLTIPPQ